MTRTEKAIEEANSRLKREYYPVALVEDFTAEVTLAYNRECKISRFKTRLYCVLCLSIGLVVGLIINA